MGQVRHLSSFACALCLLAGCFISFDLPQSDGPTGIGGASSSSVVSSASVGGQGGSVTGEGGTGGQGGTGGTNVPSETWTEAVDADAPLLWWRLNDGAAGEEKDRAGDDDPGNYSGLVSPAIESGIVGDGAMAFGEDTKVFIYDSDLRVPLQFLGHASFTLEAWVSIAMGGLVRPIVSKWNKEETTVDEAGFMLRYEPDGNQGEIVFGRYRHLSNDFDSVKAPFEANGTFHHVVATSRGLTNDNSEICLYVDGEPVGTCVSSAIAIADNQASFGLNLTGASQLAGAVDELLVYGDVLDATRVRAHYCAVVECE